MPTFNFYVNKIKVDGIRGADPALLEQKIKQWADTVGTSGGEPSLVAGQLDVMTLVDKSLIECLNENDDYPLRSFLDNTRNAKLVSDCDEQVRCMSGCLEMNLFSSSSIYRSFNRSSCIRYI
jgi:hypothetical protein